MQLTCLIVSVIFCLPCFCCVKIQFSRPLCGESTISKGNFLVLSKGGYKKFTNKVCIGYKKFTNKVCIGYKKFTNKVCIG